MVPDCLLSAPPPPARPRACDPGERRRPQPSGARYASFGPTQPLARPSGTARPGPDTARTLATIRRRRPPAWAGPSPAESARARAIGRSEPLHARPLLGNH